MNNVLLKVTTGVYLKTITVLVVYMKDHNMKYVGDIFRRLGRDGSSSPITYTRSSSLES